MVSTDANVNLLQLGGHASGLTEMAAILMEYPEWTLVLVVSPSLALLEKLHPASITLPQRTGVAIQQLGGSTFIPAACWLLGCREAIDCLPEAGPVFKQLLAGDSVGVDILSPLGTLLANLHDGGEDDLDDSSPEHPEDCLPPLHATEHADNTRTSLSYTDEGDLEDAMADEMPQNNVHSKIIIQGQETSKAKALHHHMLNH